MVKVVAVKFLSSAWCVAFVVVVVVSVLGVCSGLWWWLSCSRLMCKLREVSSGVRELVPLVIIVIVVI